MKQLSIEELKEMHGFFISSGMGKYGRAIAELISIREAQGVPVANPVLAYADSYRDMARRGSDFVPIWGIITDLERNIAPLFTAPQLPPEQHRVCQVLVDDAWVDFSYGAMENQKKHGVETRILFTAPLLPVVLPRPFTMRTGHPFNEGERAVMIPDDSGNWLSKLDVEHAIKMAGGSVDESPFREISNSTTEHFRETVKTSTNCPKCGGRGSYHCPQMLGTVECECSALTTAPKPE